MRHISCAVGDVLEVNSDVRACDDTSLPEHFAYARVVDVHPVRSKISCLASCFRHNLCSHAAYTATSDVSRASCVLFGGQTMRTRRTTDELRDESCRFLIMKPCANGGYHDRGFCHCEDGFTGQRCELKNPDECKSRWAVIFSTNTKGSLVSGNKTLFKDNIAPSSIGSIAKVKIQEADQDIILQGTVFIGNKGTNFSIQTSSTMMKQDWNHFANVPTRLFRYISQDGWVQMLQEDTDNIRVQMRAITWYARMPHYLLNISNTPTGNLFQAVTDGKELLTFSALKFNQTSLDVVGHWFEVYIDSFDTLKYVTPTNWYHRTVNASKHAEIVYVTVSSETLSQWSSWESTENFYIDSCWTKATKERTGHENSVGYLIGAVLSGHRTRVIVNDMALNVDQVLVVDNTVFFDAGYFLEPGDNSQPLRNPRSARLVVASDGRVVSCSRSLLASWDMMKSSYNASFLTWFVHTRQWSRVFTITTQGEILHGSESALVDAVSKGASLQIGLTLDSSSSYRYLLLTIRSIQTTSEGHVVAELEGLSRLLEDPGVDCSSIAMLMTSLGEVRIYNYWRRHAGNHTVGENMTMDWFVESYQP
ncbi:hypothetical protein C0Q70_07394 [Pomacea canaliculata]|uniref:EGF-like domain-containing protein n=1 Tax=Pomacea canaliculata TaxID=400727 RepID=A0A2T7PEW8_POMCA|nr:hypothetical protein C0Q70_07394 [Pomacea canaliculata]